MNLEENLTEVKENIEEAVEEVAEGPVEEAVEEIAEGSVEESVKEAAEEIVEEAENADIIDKIKNSDFGKAIFGDDGKFDREDVKRLSEGAGNAVKEGVEKIKNLFK